MGGRQKMTKVIKFHRQVESHKAIDLLDDRNWVANEPRAIPKEDADANLELKINESS